MRAVAHGMLFFFFFRSSRLLLFPSHDQSLNSTPDLNAQLNLNAFPTSTSQVFHLVKSALKCLTLLCLRFSESRESREGAYEKSPPSHWSLPEERPWAFHRTGFSPNYVADTLTRDPRRPMSVTESVVLRLLHSRVSRHILGRTLARRMHAPDSEAIFGGEEEAPVNSQLRRRCYCLTGTSGWLIRADSNSFDPRC